MQTPRREHWDGHPVELGNAWILRKGDKVARCILVTHEFGWELRLMTPELLRSQVCRSSDEVLDTHEAWKSRDDRQGLEMSEALSHAVLRPLRGTDAVEHSVHNETKEMDPCKQR